MLAQIDVRDGLENTLGDVIAFVPKLLGFLAILVIGYFVAKAIAKLVDAVLERVGFDRAVDRGGIRRALERTEYDASGIVGKLVFYTLLLFVLQLAFSVFGANPISALLTGVIAFLPKLLVAVVIVVIAAAIGSVVREMLGAALGGVEYGRMVASVAGGAILVVGVFAALNQIEIAPAIVNGLFYAMLAIIVGSAIVAIGGGGIEPMRRQWAKAMQRVERESPRIREQISGRTASAGERHRISLDEDTEMQPRATTSAAPATPGTTVTPPPPTGTPPARGQRPDM